MFTGIIEEVGLIASLIRGSQSAKLVVSVSRNFKDVKEGDSIAVNGSCLTVTKINRQKLSFDLSSETLKKTTLNDFKVGDRVNLERALSLTSRLGGHLVSGHIDGIGEIRKLKKIESGLEIHLSVPSDLIRYLVDKGSIAVDGISLTVAGFKDHLITLAVIPQTIKSTTLVDRVVGDKVNLEVDLLSKYIERHLKTQQANSGFNEEVLLQSGFLPMGWIDN